MKHFSKIILFVIMTIPALAQTGIKTQQLKFARVKQAYDEKWINLKADLKKAGIAGSFKLYIAAYKSEGKLEIWLKENNKTQYTLFKTYNFCAHSGVLGPKTREGDGQTPEGFYYINAFNPQSTYHLSLGIDYPNTIDKLRSGKDRPGGDIYIHGKCVTIGCIPLTDDKIKEVYVLAVEARNAGQTRIPVHIFPFKMTVENLNKYLPAAPQHNAFWTNLQTGYNYFEKNKNIPQVIQDKGKYIFK
jgi:murein L,D-transpeptidase YafK